MNDIHMLSCGVFSKDFMVHLTLSQFSSLFLFQDFLYLRDVDILQMMPNLVFVCVCVIKFWATGSSWCMEQLTKRTCFGSLLSSIISDYVADPC